VDADFSRRFVASAAANGIDVFRLHDPLNDVSNLREAAEAIVAADRDFEAGLVYSPGRTGEIETLIERARMLPELGAVRVLLHDPTGSLQPHTAEELVHALADAGVPLASPAPLFAVTFVLSNLVSNVPAVMLLLPVARPASDGPLLALASTLSGNLLIVGSIANIIVVAAAQRRGIRIDWRTHARAGIPVTNGKSSIFIARTPAPLTRCERRSSRTRLSTLSSSWGRSENARLPRRNCWQYPTPLGKLDPTRAERPPRGSAKEGLNVRVF